MGKRLGARSVPGARGHAARFTAFAPLQWRVCTGHYIQYKPAFPVKALAFRLGPRLTAVVPGDALVT